MSEQFNTPILLIVFNRLDTTIEVFNAIRNQKPRFLFIAADGPRIDAEEDIQKCTSVRQIVKQIDWDCQLKTLFRDKNLGCKIAVSSAITWFFNQVDKGIILEDDCVPSDSFFTFCSEMLVKYEFNSEILHIGGTNPISRVVEANSYYFSKYNRIWGWASWRRAWEYYDVNINRWPKIKNDGVLKKYMWGLEKILFTNIFDKVYAGKIDTWDYQWFLCRLLNGYAIIPDVNLVSNIGFRNDSTHTAKKNRTANLKRYDLREPIEHPTKIELDVYRDKLWRRFLIKDALRSLLQKFILLK